MNKEENARIVQINNVLGKTVQVVVDRPLGSRHPEFPDLVYPVNYGYVEGVIGGDGEAQDAYILGIAEPVSEFTGKVVAVLHREDDNEDKWAVVPDGIRFSPEEILALTEFQEKYFHTKIWYS